MIKNDIQRARRMHIADIPTRSAQRFGHKTALVDQDQRISFSEFDRYVEQIAMHMHAQGLCKGDKIMLFSHNCWQFPAILYAAARLGVIGVPINFMLNAKEVHYLLQHAQPKMLVVEDDLCAVMEQALEKIDFTRPKQVVLDLNQRTISAQWKNFEEYLVQTEIKLPDVELHADDAIRMMYTSGTESLPKGVLLSSEALMSQYTSCMVEGKMSSNDREIHAFPMYHCAQLDAFLNVDLILGATSYIFRRFEPDAVLEMISKEKITKLFCPPTAWIALLNAEKFNPVELTSLSKAYYGASAMPKAVIETLLEKLPHIGFWQFYGQTEMAPVATVLHPEDHFEYADSVGKPAFNVETQIMDEHGVILPQGEIGEIVHRSVHLTVGYDQNDEKNAESFKYGWFHSGDLGYFNEQGYLYVVDRIKDMVKSGGENVSTREVEEVIYRIEGVKEVAVFGTAHPRWIEAVTAVVIPHQNVQLDEKMIMKFCAQHLSAYKMPKMIYFDDVLPKNASGKILKRELKQQFQS